MPPRPRHARRVARDKIQPVRRRDDEQVCAVAFRDERLGSAQLAARDARLDIVGIMPRPFVDRERRDEEEDAEVHGGGRQEHGRGRLPRPVPVLTSLLADHEHRHRDRGPQGTRP